MKIRITRLVVFVSLLVIFAYLGLQAASNKPFWIDEAWVHAVSCKDTIGSMLAHGASDCSPSPLYHVIQKTLYQYLDPLGNIRVTFRIVTLASSLGVVATLFYFLLARLGWAASLLSIYLLLSQPMFFYFAAEERAYMLWTALMTGTLVSSVILLEKLQGGIPRRFLIGFSAMAFLLVLVTTPGFIQAVVAVLAVTFFAYILFPEKRASYTKWLLLPVSFILVSVFVSLPYFKANCGGIVSGPLVLNLKDPHTFHLFYEVVRLLIPKGSVSAFIWNLVVLLGLGTAVFSLFSVRRRKQVEVGWVALAFLVSYAAIAAALVIKQYYFIPRIFVGLVVLRAIFGAIGLKILLDWILGRVPRLAVVLPRVVVGGLLVLLTAKSFLMNQHLREVFRHPDLPQYTTEDCCLLHEVREVYTSKGFGLSEKSNLLVQLGSFRRFCASAPCAASIIRPQKLVADLGDQSDRFRWRISDLDEGGLEGLVRFQSSKDFCLKEMDYR